VARIPSGARAILLVSGLAFLLGNCGVMRSCSAVAPPATPPEAAVAGHRNEAELEAYTAFATAMTDAVMRPAHRRAVGAAGLVVAMLLLFASGTLVVGRRSGVWWLTQAALANVAWTVGDCVSFGAALRAHPELDRAYLRYAEAAGQLPPEAAAELARGGPGFGSIALVLYAGVAALFALAYAYLFWRVRRPDVSEVLAARPGE
jgi:hypothetical protein